MIKAEEAARQAVIKLTERPEAKDDDGFYNFQLDVEQMENIITKAMRAYHSQFRPTDEEIKSMAATHTIGQIEYVAFRDGIKMFCDKIFKQEG